MAVSRLYVPTLIAGMIITVRSSAFLSDFLSFYMFLIQRAHPTRYGANGRQVAFSTYVPSTIFLLVRAHTSVLLH